MKLENQLNQNQIRKYIKTSKIQKQNSFHTKVNLLKNKYKNNQINN